MAVQRDTPGRAGGMTLLELLVVLAAMAVLMSLLMPALAGAREAADKTRCLSRLRQLGVATAGYQADHQGVLPRPALGDHKPLSAEEKRTALWYHALDRYLQIEPADEDASDEPREAGLSRIKQDPVFDTFAPEQQEGNRTLKMNRYLRRYAGDRETVSFTRDTDIERPSETVMYADGWAVDWHPTWAMAGTRYDVSEGLVAPRHDDAANVSFADGHVRTVEQPTNPDLSAPGWFSELEGREKQKLVWRVHE